MNYLIKTVETYRMDNESEVTNFLNIIKTNPEFIVTKYSSTKKEIKAKGEIIDEYIRLEVTKIYNDEREPLEPLEV